MSTAEADAPEDVIGYGSVIDGIIFAAEHLMNLSDYASQYPAVRAEIAKLNLTYATAIDLAGEIESSGGAAEGLGSYIRNHSEFLKHKAQHEAGRARVPDAMRKFRELRDDTSKDLGERAIAGAALYDLEYAEESLEEYGCGLGASVDSDGWPLDTSKPTGTVIRHHGGAD
jgi:hypothetical protein